ncbi:MAG: hypothetical protein J2P37_25180 [Ktedonobacteraceae bacterium]|nr:hypothetical protein [Ktedonobacteraceae bacterium]
MPLGFDYHDETRGERDDAYHTSPEARETLYREWIEAVHLRGAGDNRYSSEAHPEGHPPDGADLYSNDPHSQGDPRTGGTSWGDRTQRQATSDTPLPFELEYRPWSEVLERFGHSRTETDKSE